MMWIHVPTFPPYGFQPGNTIEYQRPNAKPIVYRILVVDRANCAIGVEPAKL